MSWFPGTTILYLCGWTDSHNANSRTSSKDPWLVKSPLCTAQDQLVNYKQCCIIFHIIIGIPSTSPRGTCKLLCLICVSLIHTKRKWRCTGLSCLLSRYSVGIGKPILNNWNNESPQDLLVDILYQHSCRKGIKGHTIETRDNINPSSTRLRPTNRTKRPLLNWEDIAATLRYSPLQTNSLTLDNKLLLLGFYQTVTVQTINLGSNPDRPWDPGFYRPQREKRGKRRAGTRDGCSKKKWDFKTTELQV